MLSFKNWLTSMHKGDGDIIVRGGRDMFRHLKTIDCACRKFSQRDE